MKHKVWLLEWRKVSILTFCFVLMSGQATARDFKLAPEIKQQAIETKRLAEAYIMENYADKCLFLMTDDFIADYAYRGNGQGRIGNEMYVGHCLTILTDTEYGIEKPYYAFIDIDPKNETYRIPYNYFGITTPVDNEQAVKTFFELIGKGLRQTYYALGKNELTRGAWKIWIDEFGLVNPKLKGMQEKKKRIDQAKRNIDKDNKLGNCKLGFALISEDDNTDAPRTSIGCIRDVNRWFGLFKECEFVICTDGTCAQSNRKAYAKDECSLSAKGLYIQHVRPYVKNIMGIGNKGESLTNQIVIYDDEYKLFDLDENNLQLKKRVIQPEAVQIANNGESHKHGTSGQPLRVPIDDSQSLLNIRRC